MKFRRLLSSGMSLFFAGLYTLTAQMVIEAPQKKLIDFSQHSPLMTYYKDHISDYEKGPFDGITMKLSSATGGGNIFMVDNWEKVQAADKDTEKKLASSISTSKILNDNFLVLFGASQMDWFSDEDWTKVEEYLRYGAGIAKAAHCKGILWDAEPYKPGKNPWLYKEQEKASQHSFEEYYAQVRKRGARFIKVLQEEYPGIVIFSLRELSDFQDGSPFSAPIFPVKDKVTAENTWLNSMYGIDMTKEGAQEYYNSLFELYASWGVDYVKVDDIATPYRAPEIEAVRKAIDNSGRPMLLSLSPGNNMPSAQAEHVKQYANMWRISADFWDDWESLMKQFELCNKWSSVSGPGHWPDADMLTLGRLNLRGPNPGLGRMSNFTQEEQKTLMTLWSIFRSPLMMGGDLITLDNYTLQLLTNSEVIQVNQKSENNRQLFRDGDKIAWVADVQGSSDKYLALFYTGDMTASELKVDLSGLGFNGSCTVRDLWNHTETVTVSEVLKITLPAHGAIFGIRKKTIIPLTTIRPEEDSGLTRVHLWGAILPEQVRMAAWI